MTDSNRENSQRALTSKLEVKALVDIEGYIKTGETAQVLELPVLHVANERRPTGFYIHAGEYELLDRPETECPLPASDRNTILDAMHYPREYLARWKGKGNSANAQHTLDRLQNMLERTQAGDRKETVPPQSEQLVCRKCGSSDVMPWPTSQKTTVALCPNGHPTLHLNSGVDRCDVCNWTGPYQQKAAGSPSEAAMQIIAAVCHSVSGTCCHMLKDGHGPCTIENCSAVRGYLGAPNGEGSQK